MEFNWKNPIHVFSLMFFIRMSYQAPTFDECLGVLIVITAMHADRVFSFLFPKRIDVFGEISRIKEKLIEYQNRNDELERDVTALKIGGMKR